MPDIRNKKRGHPLADEQDSGLSVLDSLVPPNSAEAEQGVLGGILFSPDAFHRVADKLKPDDFYRGAHRHIFAAMIALSECGEPIDIITVSERMNDLGLLEAAGGRTYLMDLAMSVSTAENAVWYANIIRRKATLRRLITTGNEIASKGYESDEPDVVLEYAQQEIFQLAQEGVTDAMATVHEILPDSMASIRERCANKGTLMGLGSGFYDLDAYTSGFQKSDLIILAARPSMGKTAFCLNLVTHAALRQGEAVLFFSLEMSRQQLVNRMLCAEAEVDAQRMRTGELNEHDISKLEQAMALLDHAPIHIDDSPGLTVTDMRTRARKVQLSGGQPLGLIVIDYLQLMESRVGGGENRAQEISVISRGLKGLARELGVPVIALSQLSRAVESRQDKKPMLSDLRESGAIEQDADLVMFIYRDEYYNKDSERPGTADIIIAKQRNGPVGEVSLLFRHSITRFLNPADRKITIF